MSTDCDRELDFIGVLAELQGLLGERVTVEAASRSARPYLQAYGVLCGALDLELAGSRSLDPPARLAFCLEGAEAHFVVREDEIRAACAYTVKPPDGPSSRTVEIGLPGGARLIVAGE